MILTHFSKFSQPRNSVVLGLASLSGLFYCSWPLGFVLNPLGSRGLVSNLAGFSQPYNWLFIGFDIVCTGLVLLIAYWLWQKPHIKSSKLGLLIIGTYAAFGVTTFLSAIVPIDCAIDQQQCGNLLQHPMAALHGLFSILSIGLLTLNLLSFWWWRQRLARLSFLQSSLFTLFVVGWFSAGLITAYVLITEQPSAGPQYIFITANSVWLGAFPSLMLTGQKNRRRPARAVKSRLDV